MSPCEVLESRQAFEGRTESKNDNRTSASREPEPADKYVGIPCVVSCSLSWRLPRRRAPSTGAVPQPFPVPGGPPATTPAPPEARSGRGAAPPRRRRQRPPTATRSPDPRCSLRGTPYRNGGRDPVGVRLQRLRLVRVRSARRPRAADGRGAVPRRHRCRPGRSSRRRSRVLRHVNGPARQTATHVGISIGGDEFVHAPSTTGEVRVERLGSSYWAPRFVGARRMP